MTETLTEQERQHQAAWDRTIDLRRQLIKEAFAYREDRERDIGHVAVENTEWMLKGACRKDPEPFYPPEKRERKIEKLHREDKAITICAGCVVREECLEYAVTHHEEYGIWGGLTEKQREELT